MHKAASEDITSAANESRAIAEYVDLNVGLLKGSGKVSSIGSL